MNIAKTCLMSMLLAATAVGCGSSSSDVVTPPLDTAAPIVSSTYPVSAAIDMPITGSFTATFNKGMTAGSLNTTTVTLKQGATAVDGAVTFAGMVATFAPTSPLTAGTSYTASISIGATDSAGVAMASAYSWNFTTSAAASGARAPVALGTAARFAILSKTGVTDVPASVITGDVGASPITGAAILVTCTEVTGTIYTADAAGPMPCRVTDATLLTTAIADMEIAYTDAAGRVTPDFTELGAGNIDGKTLVPGLYKWSSGVLIPVGVTLAGGANDVWIFQIAQDLVVSPSAKITLSGGAQAKNVFWQVAGQATIDTGATVEGTILSMTLVSMNTGAVLNGRALAQSQVTLQQNTVTRP